jgi:hypothetical protein
VRSTSFVLTCFASSLVVWVEAGEWRPGILQEYAFLIQTQNCILRFKFFRNSLNNFLKMSEIFLKKKIVKSAE